ncbi:MAG: hypothetical protein K5931_04810, partial [Lachnospiraceae bacterium]|nr:hypothetical protein [Lachnospiraceae bacterium]
MKRSFFKKFMIFILSFSLLLEPATVMADFNTGDIEDGKEAAFEDLSLDGSPMDRVKGGIPVENITDNREALINDLRALGEEELLSELESEEDSELEQSYNALKINEEGRLENLSELKYVTPVKDQVYTRHCWAFAGAATIETNMWKQHPNGISSSQTYGETGASIPDISAKDIAWRELHKPYGDDLTDSRKNDYISIEDMYYSDPYYAENYRHLNEYYKNKNIDDQVNADNYYLCFANTIFAACDVFFSEKKLKEMSKDLINDKESDFYRGGYSDAIKDTYLMYGEKNGESRPEDLNTYYSEDEQKYQVNNFRVIEFIDSEEDIKDVKKLVKEYGGVYLGVKADNFAFQQNDGEKIGFPGEIYLTGSYKYLYDPFDDDLNHFVEIVGWDDSIKKENFTYYPRDSFEVREVIVDGETKNYGFLNKDAQGYVPERDGAFIIKNSWGSQKSFDGYCYMSYCDKSYKVAAVFDTAVKTDKDPSLPIEKQWHDNTYQSILGQGPFEQTTFCSEGNCYGSLYTVNAEAKAEEITGVNILTLSEGSAWKVSIYKDGEDIVKKGILDDTDLVAAQKAVFADAGYNTVYFDEPVTVNKGDTFFVKVETILSDNTSDYLRALQVAAPNDGVKDGDSFAIDDIYGGTKLNYNGCETPLYYIGSDGSIIEDEAGYELAIKVYTNDTDPVSCLRFSEDAVSRISVTNKDTFDYSQMLEYTYFDPSGDPVTVSGDDLRRLGTLSFRSLDPSVISISTEGIASVKYSGAADITASFIYKDANGKQQELRESLNVTVYDDLSFSEDGLVSLKKNTFFYKGSEIKPSVTVTLGDTYTLKENRDYTVTYKDNIEKGTGTVTVKLSDGCVFYDPEIASNNEKSISFKIVEKNIADSDIILNGLEPSYEIGEAPDFTGDASTLELLYKADQSEYEVIDPKETSGIILKNGEDYKISYKTEDIASAGLKCFEIQGVGGYTGSRIFSYELVDYENDPASDPSSSGVYVSDITPKTVSYDGKSHVLATDTSNKKDCSYDLSLTVKRGNYTLTEGYDYTLSYFNNINASVDETDPEKMPCIIVKGKGEFSGLYEKRYFTIKPRDLSELNLSLEGIEAVYNIKDGEKAVLKPSAIRAGELCSDGSYNTYGLNLVSKKSVLADCCLRYYRYDADTGAIEELTDAKDSNTVYLSGKKNIIYIVPEGRGNYTGAYYDINDPESDKADLMKVILADSSSYTGSDKVNMTCKKDLKLDRFNTSLSVKDLIGELSLMLNGKQQSMEYNINPESSDEAALIVIDPFGDIVKDEELDTAGTYKVTALFDGTELTDGSDTYQLMASKTALVTVKGEKLQKSELVFKGSDNKTYSATSTVWDYDGSSTTLTPIYGGTDSSSGNIAYDERADILVNNSDAASYTLDVYGRGIYNGSVLTMKLVRKPLNLNKAVENSLISVTADPLSVNVNVNGTQAASKAIIITLPLAGTMSRVRTDTIYNNAGRSAGLDLTFKNNKKVGAGDLILKAGKNSNYSGSFTIKDFIDLNKITIDQDIPLIDKVEYSQQSASARETRADNIYAQVTDAIGSKKPVLKLYQYDAWGINRKEIKLSADNITLGDGYFELSGDNPYLEFAELSSDGQDKKCRIAFGKYDQKPKKVALSG